jgi:penicillin-binding protein A
MNRPIRRVTLVTMVMFALLLGNATFSALFRQDSLNAHPQNRRVRDAQFAQERGSILAVGKTEIATTKTVDDRFRFQRVYPQGPRYAVVTGYYSYDHAATGLENRYNGELSGTDDSLFVRRLVNRLTGERVQGASIQTTIVPKIQEAAVKALGDQKGAVVALDPSTGAVLALATSPTYDPNDIASHDIEEANRAYERLAGDRDRPLANRAVREIYPPGSTFKLVTAAAALGEGMTAESRVDSPTRLRLPGSSRYLRNSTNCGGSKVTLTQALRVSCNTAFASLGLDLGEEKLREQAARFGFDQRHLPELTGVASRFPDKLDDAQLALSSIGQFDVAASPLQIAMVSAAIANDGVLMDPYLVSMVQAPDLTPLQTHRRKVLSQAMAASDARQLRQMMVEVVATGTGRNAQIPGVEVGGKTGTAQTDPRRKPFAWFTSFAPADDAKVAVAVVIEDADVPRSDIAGGRLAAPIARAVMLAAL